jgi:signal transduction histidine kinase
MSDGCTSNSDQILVVDDTPDNLVLMHVLLEGEGYTIQVATDGKTALEKIAQAPPDLILLDVMMPGMDGYEVTRRLRKSHHEAYIPVLLVTAHDQSSLVEGLDAGADDFVRKPFDPDELLARVRSLLRLKHSIDNQNRMMRQREDFVSRLTHDLRTPLIAADRMLQLMRQGTFGEISPELAEAIAIMIQSNHSLLQMVNTLLEVHRHEAGQKNFNFAVCNLWDISKRVAQELTPLALDKGLELSVKWKSEPCKWQSEPGRSGQGRSEMSQFPNSDQGDSPTAPSPHLEDLADHTQETVVMGDPQELWRMLTNLVGNAIKFTDQGSVEILLSTHAAEQTPERTWVIVTVADTGAGIPQSEQETLFERFRQGNHKRAGSGLGLHLSWLIVDAHGGDIQVCSAPGEGSRMTVRLPQVSRN